jgi:MoxR-like ATPase
VVNEKVYRNGEQEVPVKIKAIVSASNELPPEGEGLGALWDRFLVRYVITEIRQSAAFVGMITDTANVYEDNLEEDLKLPESELDAWDPQIDRIEVPAEVLNVIQVVKYRLESYDAEHPDSPFQHFRPPLEKDHPPAAHVGLLNDRTRVDLMDCFLLPHCLWNRPEQLETAREIVA